MKTTRDPKTTDPELPEQKETGGSPASGKDDPCRCKEVSQLQPRGLLRLMMSDLAFWKKKKE
jgi:hypothetical protein